MPIFWELRAETGPLESPQKQRFFGLEGRVGGKTTDFGDIFFKLDFLDEMRPGWEMRRGSGDFLVWTAGLGEKQPILPNCGDLPPI